MYFVILLFLSSALYASTISKYQQVFNALQPIMVEAQKMPSSLPRTARHFCRIFTNNAGQCDSVSHASLNVLLNRHYVEKWVTASNALSWGNNGIQSSKTPLEKFHETLALRFNNIPFCNFSTSSIECRLKKATKDITSFNDHHLFDRDNFVEGHQIVLKDITFPFPLVVAAFFDKKIKNPKTPKPHNYFVPIEQALLMTKRSQILDRLALLEGNTQMLGGWGIEYTGAAIGLIAPNTKITGSIGPVASQTYAPLYPNDLRKKVGGATQLYIAKVSSPVRFIDANIIRLDQHGNPEDKLYFIEELENFGLLMGQEPKVFSEIFSALDKYP